jgi:diadenosine tetraphosphate (Ap4A) HIT family hydrolase
MRLTDAQAQGIAPWQHMTVDLDSVKVFCDRYPVTPGHRLFVPEQDTPDLVIECLRQAYKYGKYLMEQGGCDGFNVGINHGQAAGQTVMYPHVHCIPRRRGDCEDPTGGVRGVIAGQANYRASAYRNPNDR